MSRAITIDAFATFRQRWLLVAFEADRFFVSQYNIRGAEYGDVRMVLACVFLAGCAMTIATKQWFARDLQFCSITATAGGIERLV